MTSDPPLHVALGPDLRRPSVRLLKVISVPPVASVVGVRKNA